MDIGCVLSHEREYFFYTSLNILVKSSKGCNRTKLGVIKQSLLITIAQTSLHQTWGKDVVELKLGADYYG